MKTLSIKILTLAMVLTLAVCLGMAGEAKAQQPNVGVFDLQKVLNDSKKGKAARTGLESTFKKMQSDLKAKEAELNKLGNELKKQIESKSISTDVLRKKDEELKNKVRAFQEQTAKYEEDMRKAEEKSLKPLIDKAIKTAGDLGRSRGYILVLESQQAGVVFAEPSMDLTAEVMKAVDK